MTVIAITCPRCAREGWLWVKGPGPVPCHVCHGMGDLEVRREWGDG